MGGCAEQNRPGDDRAEDGRAAEHRPEAAAATGKLFTGERFQQQPDALGNEDSAEPALHETTDNQGDEGDHPFLPVAGPCLRTVRRCTRGVTRVNVTG